MNSFRYQIRFLRWYLGHTIPMIMCSPSLYPELPRKSAVRRLFENIYIYFRDGAPCAGYNGLGLDVKGARLNDFVSNHCWMKILERQFCMTGIKDITSTEKVKAVSCIPTYVLQNKQCFWSTLDRYGIPVVPVLAHAINGVLYDFTSTDKPLSSYDRLFVKPIDGDCGKGTCLLVQRDGRFYDGDRLVELNEFASGNQEFIFQPLIENHPKLKALNPATLNTMRIVTCRTRTGEYELWDPGMIRIGRSNAIVDNFAQGGMGVGLTEDGKLKRYGYSHDKNYKYSKTERHPDSQIIFDGYEIPFYTESVDLILKTHKLFPQLQTIGWDVAITADGPILVEANHRSDIEMLEVVHHKGSAARLREIFGKDCI